MQFTVTPSKAPAHPLTGERVTFSDCYRVTPTEPLRASDAAGMQQLRRAGARALHVPLRDVMHKLTTTPARDGFAFLTVWVPVEWRPLADTGTNRAQAAGHAARLGHPLLAHLEPVGGGLWAVVRECCPDTAAAAR